MKVSSTDEWQLLLLNDESKSFLSSVPDIRKRPPTRTKNLDNVEDVTEQIDSNENLINNMSKMVELYKIQQGSRFLALC